MKTFYIILANSLAASIVNNFVWFAVTFWVFLETQSVIATSVMAGVFTTIVALSGFFLGSLVDRFPKKNVMLVSSAASLGLYGLSAAVFVVTPAAALSDPASPALWAFIVSALIGAIAGNLRGIAVATLVTIMIPEDGRDKANGLVGTSTGIGFLAASIFSGLAVAYVGMAGMLAIAIVLTGVVMAHLWTVPVPAAPAPQTAKASPAGSPEVPSAGMVDIPGTIRAIVLVPGLFALILFHTFNNFLAGVYMSLMDAYGLLLVSVQTWGTLVGRAEPGLHCGRDGGRPARPGAQPAAHPVPVQYRHVDDLRRVRAAGLDRITGRRDVPLALPNPCGRGGRADHPAEGGYARAPGAGVRLRPKRRAGRLAGHVLFDWPDRPVVLHPLHDHRRRRPAARDLVRHWHRSGPGALVQPRGTDRAGRHPGGDAVPRLPGPVGQLRGPRAAPGRA